MRVDEHTITLDQSPVFYRTAPSSGILAVYLHGVPTSSDDWMDFLSRTGGIAPDLIGFGRSGKSGHLDYSIDGYADFVVRLLETLQADRVKLVLHDWGAVAGLRFAQRRPERVERVVLINPVPLFDGFRWHRLARLWRRPVLGELAMGSVNSWLLGRVLRSGSSRPDAWPADRVAAVWEQFDQGTQRAILRLHRGAGDRELAAAGLDLERLRMPVLIVWGEKDPWFPEGVAERYVDALANARLDRLAEAGHWPWLDQRDVIERVSGFLEASV